MEDDRDRIDGRMKDERDNHAENVDDISKKMKMKKTEMKKMAEMAKEKVREMAKEKK